MAYGQEIFFDGTLDIVKAYESGLIGADCNPEDADQLRMMIQADGGMPDGAMACTNFGLAESGKGKLSIPFLDVLKIFPDCWPGPAQGRGDCVSHDCKNAALVTMCTDITSGLPDEVTGRVEGAPEISDAGRLAGVLSSEAIYNWRGHSGDGWSCSAAAQVIMKKSGLWLRKPYPEINVDFTQYSARNAGIYGRRPPPDTWLEIGKDRLMRTATFLDEPEVVRDMVHNGYGVSSCGGESFSGQRDENGVAERTRKGWAHAMAIIGCDDRDIIKKIYGEMLVLVLNSWGIWNSGPRKIYGTNILIPEGSFWTKWSNVKNRQLIAYSGFNGWPPKKLLTFGATGRW
jgi:hypothetical protein